MTSGGTFPKRLTKVDELTRGDHHYLTPDDNCYFLGEYTARRGYAFSPTNNLILNFKKSVALRGTAQWPYKERAIQEAAAAFRSALNSEWLKTATMVPMPPSKANTDPLYDDRLLRMLNVIVAGSPADVRELVVQPTSTLAAHERATGSRPNPDDLEAFFQIDEASVRPPPTSIGIFDDVLTTGAHFRAASSLLLKRFPSIRVIGLFIARRAPESSLDDFTVIE